MDTRGIVSATDVHFAIADARGKHSASGAGRARFDITQATGGRYERGMTIHPAGGPAPAVPVFVRLCW